MELLVFFEVYSVRSRDDAADFSFVARASLGFRAY